EGGGGEFDGGVEAAEIPVERVRLRRDVDRVAFAQLRRVVRRTRPSLLHTRLVHADAYGLPAGKLARVPVLASTKHGFNSFRERRAFAAGDPALARLRDPHIALSARAGPDIPPAPGPPAGALPDRHPRTAPPG